MTRTAEEYQTLLKAVFTFAISEEEAVLDKILQDTVSAEYQRGFVAGLKEAQRKIEASTFLINS